MNGVRWAHRLRWIGPCLIVGGVAAILFEFLHPRGEPYPLRVRCISAATRHDELLPLVGLAFTLAQLPLRLCLAGLCIFLAAIPAGGLFASWITANADRIELLPLVGPACCLLVGLTLVAPTVLRAFLTPSVSFVMGLALGLVIDYSASSLRQWSFALGYLVFGVWLTLTLMVTWRAFAKPWLSIPARIFGSWLIAMGAMLSAAQLI